VPLARSCHRHRPASAHSPSTQFPVSTLAPYPEQLILSSGSHSVLPLTIRCKLLISRAVTATNQKVRGSNLSGHTILFKRLPRSFQPLFWVQQRKKALHCWRLRGGIQVPDSCAGTYPLSANSYAQSTASANPQVCPSSAFTVSNQCPTIFCGRVFHRELHVTSNVVETRECAKEGSP
jgi:hypothetical protein